MPGFAHVCTVCRYVGDICGQCCIFFRISNGANDHPFRAIFPNKPDRRVHVWISLCRHELVTKFLVDIIPDDLNGKIVKLPIRHLDLFVSDLGDRIYRLPRFIIDKAPTWCCWLPICPDTPHQHAAWMPIAALCNGSEAIWVSGAAYVFFHIVNANKEQLIA